VHRRYGTTRCVWCLVPFPYVVHPEQEEDLQWYSTSAKSKDNIYKIFKIDNVACIYLYPIPYPDHTFDAHVFIAPANQT
jgi:hypothetical protein